MPDILIPAGAAIAAFLIVRMCSTSPIKTSMKKTCEDPGKGQLVRQIRAAVENPTAYFEASEKAKAEVKQQEAQQKVLDMLLCREENTKVRPMISMTEAITGISKAPESEFPAKAQMGQMFETSDGRFYMKGPRGWCEIISKRF